jgi:serine/threonine protein kinase
VTEALDKLAPGALIAGDYLVLSVERAETPERCFLATDRENDRRVRVAELPSATAGAWAAAAIEHPAVVELCAVLSALGGSFGVFNEVAGATVADELARVGRLNVQDAVGAALRVAEALAVLHRAGVVHGAVGPASVVLKPAETDKPVLSYAPPSQRPMGYCAPDRRGLASAREDDLWATGGLLYQMLTGQPPPEAGLVGPEQVIALDVADELLVGVMVQALAADPNRRSVRIASMRHPLKVWLERRAAQPRSVREPPRKPQVFAWSRAMLSSPAAPARPPRVPRPIPPRVPRPIPPPAAPAERSSDAPQASERDSSPAIEIAEVEERISIEPLSEDDEDTPQPPSEGDEDTPQPPSEDDEDTPEPPTPRAHALVSPTPAHSPSRAPRMGWMLGGAAAVVLVVIGLTTVHRGAPDAPHPRAVRPRAPARPVARRHAPALPVKHVASAAAPRASAPPSPVSVGSCIAAHSPPGSFAVTPDLNWVCQTTDARKGAQRMRAAVVRGAAGHSITRAMRLWAAVTWYGMAAFAAVRGACCPSAAAIELPPPGAGCTPLADALNDLGRRAAQRQAFDPALAAFDQGVLCELGHDRAHVYWQSGRLHDGERSVLDELLAPVRQPKAAPDR